MNVFLNRYCRIFKIILNYKDLFFIQSNSYFSVKKKRYLIAEEKLSMCSSTTNGTSKILIFKHAPHTEHFQKKKVSSVANKPTLLHKPVFGTDTDEDIFSQYM